MFYLLLAFLAASLTGSNAEMEQYLFDNEVLLTYCGLFKGHRIYKMEDLDLLCSAKAQFFGDQVSLLDRMATATRVIPETNWFSISDMSSRIPIENPRFLVCNYSKDWLACV